MVNTSGFEPFLINGININYILYDHVVNPEPRSLREHGLCHGDQHSRISINSKLGVFWSLVTILPSLIVSESLRTSITAHEGAVWQVNGKSVVSQTLFMSFFQPYRSFWISFFELKQEIPLLKKSKTLPSWAAEKTSATHISTQKIHLSPFSTRIRSAMISNYRKLFNVVTDQCRKLFNVVKTSECHIIPRFLRHSPLVRRQ